MVKRIVLALISALALVAATPVGAPLRTECKKGTTVTLEVHILPSEEIVNVYRAAGGTADLHHNELNGFLGTSESGNLALVVPPLRGQNDKETLAVWGHELAHVLCGDFHR